MTKFDIRVRRKQFTQSRIERHKNYQSLLDRHYEAGKKRTRGIMVLAFLIILIIAILLAFFNTPEAPADKMPVDNLSYELRHLDIGNLTGEKIYQL